MRRFQCSESELQFLKQRRAVLFGVKSNKTDAASQQSFKRHRLQCSMFCAVWFHKMIAVGFNTFITTLQVRYRSAHIKFTVNGGQNCTYTAENGKYAGNRVKMIRFQRVFARVSNFDMNLLKNPPKVKKNRASFKMS